jgi:hypothetical protein
VKRWFLLLIIAVYLGGVAGCSHMRDYLNIAREKGISEDYLTVLNRWTRSQIIYSQFETMAHIAATYRSREFNQAYLREFTKIYHLRAGETKAREEIPTAMTADFTEFICYAYIPEKTSNDFDRRGSIWTIFLVKDSGERVDPVEVRKIEPITPAINEFFPYINPYYGISYRLRFPPLFKEGGDTGHFKLVFASVIGEVTLEFGKR